MKKLQWTLTTLAFVACGLFAAVQLGWFSIRQPDFDSNNFKPEEPMDLTPYEPAVCEIHRTEMHAEIVPIQYGTPISMFQDKDGKRLLAPGEIDPELRHSLFPHAEHATWGGCVLSNLDSKTARIRICSDCERAEQNWRQEHLESK